MVYNITGPFTYDTVYESTPIIAHFNTTDSYTIHIDTTSAYLGTHKYIEFKYRKPINIVPGSYSTIVIYDPENETVIEQIEGYSLNNGQEFSTFRIDLVENNSKTLDIICISNTDTYHDIEFKEFKFGSISLPVYYVQFGYDGYFKSNPVAGNYPVCQGETIIFDLIYDTEKVKIKNVYIDGVGVEDKTPFVDNVTLTIGTSSKSIIITGSDVSDILYKVTTSTNTGGYAAPAGVTYVKSGDSLTVKAYPAENYLIDYTIVDGVTYQDTYPEHTFENITSDHVFQAVFAAGTQTYYTVTTLPPTNGTLYPAGTTQVLAGGSYLVNAVPATGYKLKDLKINDTSVGEEYTYKLEQVLENYTVTAEFEYDTGNMNTIRIKRGTYVNLTSRGAKLDDGELGYDRTNNELRIGNLLGQSLDFTDCPIIGGGSDEKIKISANDTTADHLINKLIAGDNITITETNDGSNETIVISSTGSGGGVSEDIYVKTDETDTTASYLINKVINGNQIAIEIVEPVAGERKIQITATPEWGGITGDLEDQTDLFNALGNRVVGPENVTANSITRFDGDTGKIIKSSPAILDDFGKLSINAAVNGSSSKAEIDLNPNNSVLGFSSLILRGRSIFNDIIGMINFYNRTAEGTNLNTARISVISASESSNGSHIIFATQPITGGSLIERLRLTAGGQFIVNSVFAPENLDTKLFVVGNIGLTGNVLYNGKPINEWGQLIGDIENQTDLMDILDSKADASRGVTNGDAHDHHGGDGAQIAYNNLSGLPILGNASSKNVGTGADEVAAGNHTHSDLPIVTENLGKIKLTAEDGVFDYIGNKIIYGNGLSAIYTASTPDNEMHQSIAVDETEFDYTKIPNRPTLGDAAALNVGTIAGTVAAGDHSHGELGDLENLTKIRVTSNDLTPAYLDDKISPGHGLDSVIDDIAGSETYSIFVDETKLDYTKLQNLPNLGTAAFRDAGTINGIAELGENGKVLPSQLPESLGNILEFANFASFPTTGVTNTLYVAKDTNKTYRWTGTQYIEISASLALGETADSAYRGDRGKTAYDHSQAAHAPSNAQKNSDILKSEIEAKLTGSIATHTHPGMGTITGPVSTTANALSYFTDTTGKVLGQIPAVRYHPAGSGYNAGLKFITNRADIDCGINSRNAAGHSILQIANNINTTYFGAIDQSLPGCLVRLDTRNTRRYGLFNVHTRAAGATGYERPFIVFPAPSGSLVVEPSGNVQMGWDSETSTDLGYKLSVNGSINASNHKIVNVATPTENTDAANKAYVDSQTGQLGNLTNKKVWIGDATNKPVEKQAAELPAWQANKYLRTTDTEGVLEYADGSFALPAGSAGSILYCTGNNTWVALSPGTEGQVLVIDSNGLPSWQDIQV